MPADPLAPLLDLPGVSDAADAARRSVDRLLTHQAMRRRGAEVSAEAGLRCARATAALEGVDVPLAVLREQAPDDAVLQGALRLSAELPALVPVMERSPAQALARIHLLACAGAVPDAQLGRPRTADDPLPPDPLRLGPAPSADELAPRLTTLAHVLAAAPPAVPAVVVAAVAHGELLALRAFPAGNGVVARTAARVLLVARGFDPRGASAPEVGYAQDPPAYAAAARGFATGDDVGGWLVFCARASEHGAVEGVAICEALMRNP